MRTLIGVLLILVGLPIAAYGGIGSLFVAGGLQRGETNWTDVGIIAGIAAFGTALFSLGVVILIRGTKRTFFGASLLFVGFPILYICGFALLTVIGADGRGQMEWTVVAKTLAGAIVGAVLCGLGIMLMTRGKKPNPQ